MSCKGFAKFENCTPVHGYILPVMCNFSAQDLLIKYLETPVSQSVETLLITVKKSAVHL